MDIYSIEDFKEYFQALSQGKERYIVIVCARDNIGMKMPKQFADAALGLGIKTDLHRKRGLGGTSHRAYIAVIDGGEAQHEFLGGREGSDAAYAEGIYDIKSTVWTEAAGCADAKIGIDGTDCCVNGRGLNIVVISKEGNEIIDSVCFDCHTAETACRRVEDYKAINEYRAFRKGYIAEGLPDLALFKPRYPYGEIAVVASGRTDRQEESLLGLAKEEGLHACRLNGATVMSTFRPETDKDGATYVFSGMTIRDGKLIYGGKDVKKHGIAANDLREGIGEFELLVSTDGKLELSTDFFGMCQWYYYKADGQFITATSYHLLLLTLKAMGIKMRLDTRKTAAAMAFFGAITQCSFTDAMDVEGCFEMANDKRIVIREGTGPAFENTGLFDEIHSPEPFTEAAYEGYLFQTKEEIISNVRAILEHPDFDYVLCDLTGGLDSRMLLAAAQNLPQSLTKKIRVNNTRNNCQEEFDAANSIVNAFGFRWHDIPSVLSYCGIGVSEGKMRQSRHSHNLGTYYMSSYMPDIGKVASTIHLSGHCGEAMYRQFYGWKGYSMDDDAFVSLIGKSLDVPDSANARAGFKHFMQKSISVFPCESIEEQLDLHYLFYRNRHHCRRKYAMSTPFFAPLQSKTGFHCKRMYFAVCVDAKMQYDVLFLLNPLMANLPFGSAQHTKYLADNQGKLYSNGYPKADIAPCHDTSAADNIHRANEYIPDKETVDREGKATKDWHKDEKTLLSALKAFLDYSEDFEELGLPLYKYFTRDRHNTEYGFNYHVENTRINRILSACWQIKLISEDAG